MKWTFFLVLVAAISSCSAQKKSEGTKGWISLFDGKTFNNWTPSDNAETFRIDSGMIIVNGNRSHLYYSGPLKDRQFKNFELKVRVMTMPGANSGIYFHTQYKPTGWPSKGYEVQVNNSHTDWRRTGSLYAVQDVRETYVKDYEWYTEYIKVEGKHIIVKINDKTVVDYIEPDGIETTKGREEKHLGTGTFALQGHDPKSKIYYKDIMVRILPD